MGAVGGRNFGLPIDLAHRLYGEGDFYRLSKVTTFLYAAVWLQF